MFSVATTQLKVRGAIALMVTFIFMSQWVGLEAIFGAFIAGMLATLISGKEKSSELEMKLDALGYGFFIPVFFISVGIDLNLSVFSGGANVLKILFMLIAAAFLIKIIPALAFLNKFKMKDALSSGILLSSTLSLPIAATTIGVKLNIISEEVNSSVVMMAIVTCILAPVVFNRLTEEKKQEEKEIISIIGGNDFAITLAEDLLSHKIDLLIAPQTNNEYDIVKNRALPVVLPTNSINESLLNAKIPDAKAIIAATDKDELNLSICLIAKDCYGVHTLFSLVNNPENTDLYKENNIEPISKSLSSAEDIIYRLTSPDAYSAFSHQSEHLKIAEVVLTNEEHHGMPISTLRLHKDVLIIQVKRDLEILVPHGQTILRLHDRLTLVGKPAEVQETVTLLGISSSLYCPLPKYCVLSDEIKYRG